MNPSVISWISQQSPLQLYSNTQCRQTTPGMDNSTLINQFGFLDSFDEDFASVFGQDIQNYLSTENNSLLSSSTDSYSEFSTLHNLGVLEFSKQYPPEDVVPEGTINLNCEEAKPRVPPAAKKKRIRPPSQTNDHIIAERRRREQLTQLFVALSALIPGLKKMDKGSILEDAIKYMKHLQERVKVLEEKTERKAMESVVIVKKSQIVIDDDGEAFSDEQSSSFEEEQLPAIEARVCDNHILVKVHCEKHKDALATLICKVESLNMIIVSTNATLFGDVTLDITLVAEMEKEFNLTVGEVVTALREALHPAS